MPALMKHSHRTGEAALRTNVNASTPGLLDLSEDFAVPADVMLSSEHEWTSHIEHRKQGSGTLGELVSYRDTCQIKF